MAVVVLRCCHHSVVTATLISLGHQRYHYPAAVVFVNNATTFSSTSLSLTSSSLPVVNNNLPNNDDKNNDNNDVNIVPINFDTSSYISGEESQILKITFTSKSNITCQKWCNAIYDQGYNYEVSLGGTTGRRDGAFTTGLAGIAHWSKSNGVWISIHIFTK